MYKSIAKILLFMLHPFYKKSLNNLFQARKFHDNCDDYKTSSPWHIGLPLQDMLG